MFKNSQEERLADVFSMLMERLTDLEIDIKYLRERDLNSQYGKIEPMDWGLAKTDSKIVRVPSIRSSLDPQFQDAQAACLLCFDTNEWEYLSNSEECQDLIPKIAEESKYVFTVYNEAKQLRSVLIEMGRSFDIACIYDMNFDSLIIKIEYKRGQLSFRDLLEHILSMVKVLSTTTRVSVMTCRDVEEACNFFEFMKAVEKGAETEDIQAVIKKMDTYYFTPMRNYIHLFMNVAEYFPSLFSYAVGFDFTTFTTGDYVRYSSDPCETILSRLDSIEEKIEMGNY